MAWDLWGLDNSTVRLGYWDEANPDLARMSTSEKARYFALLHDGHQADPNNLSGPEMEHYRSLAGFAEQHFGTMQADAQKAVQYWDAYHANGRQHPNGLRSLSSQPGNHDPALTGAWAAQSHAGDRNWKHYGPGGQVLHHRAVEYKDALDRVAQEGPLGIHENGNAHFVNLENAHNKMRAELQHQGDFTVPTIDQLSRIEHPEDWTTGPRSSINPRYFAGTGHKGLAAHDRAYQVNCQRVVLAADARLAGYNVEAQRSLNDPNARKENNDKQFEDPEIADWWRNPDGTGGTWIDAEDHPELRGYPTAGGAHWDHMTEQIAKWGPGARGIVAPTYPTGEKTASRHVLNVHVNDQGKVIYSDHQSGESDERGDGIGDRWRNKVGYDLLASHKANRDHARSTQTPENARKIANAAFSPLRYMRTDDKTLAPETSQWMIDRGTAPTNKTIAPIADDKIVW